MIVVELIGHDSFYGIGDVLRLFFSGIKEDRDRSLVTADGSLELRIISEVSEGKVFTYLEGDKRTEDTLEPIDVKRAVKRSLYSFLSNLTDTSFPWGCLTGIRPTVVATEENYSEENLIKKYLVREDKARLASITGRIENTLLESISLDSLNVYVGVPFCPSRCEYCSFISKDVLHHLNMLSEYEEALSREFKVAGKSLGRNIETLYLGGGTPTVFEDKVFAKLLEDIRSNLPIADLKEFTCEAGRPDTITEFKLDAMKDAGVGRICINPQTMRSETLAKLNRKHSAEDIIDAYKLARSKKFEVINMDLIAGLKYETSGDFIYSVKTLIDLDPENITVHTLYKKRRAEMSRDDVMDFKMERGMVDDAVKEGYELLMNAGYVPYYMYRQKDTGHGLENIGFAKKGTECLYNVAMMTDKRDVLSFGAGGMSKRIFEGNRYERCPCTKDIHSFIREPEHFAMKKIKFFTEDT